MKKAFTVIRVSREDQLKGYGPDVQWFDDVIPNAPSLGLEISEELRRVIQESATGWDRDKFQEAVKEGIRLYHEGRVEALLFPRVDRETRFVVGSMPLLSEVVRTGMEVYFAREQVHFDPFNPDSVRRYTDKALSAQEYAQEWTKTSMAARRRRAEDDAMMPSGGHKWAFDYHPFRKRGPFARASDSGRFTRNEDRAEHIRACADWLLNEGANLNECCRRLKAKGVPTPKGGTDWSRATLRGILRDPALIGEFYGYMHKVTRDKNNKRRVVATDPSEWVLVYRDPSQAIFTKEQFQAIGEQLRRNQQNSSRHTKYWFPPIGGMVVCGGCRKQDGNPRRMSGFTASGGPYYRCDVCRNLINGRKLWNDLQEGIKARLLEPRRLVPAVKAQLDSGQTLDRLEEEQARLESEQRGWEQSREKARRLHLLPHSKYSLEQYLADDHRVQEQLKRVDVDLSRVKRQIAETRQATVDEERIRQFCEQAAHNFENMDEDKWRVLLERMRLQVVVSPNVQPVVHLALPTVKEPVSEIALKTSPGSTT